MTGTPWLCPHGITSGQSCTLCGRAVTRARRVEVDEPCPTWCPACLLDKFMRFVKRDDASA
jgi:hypothetical protein